MQIVEKKIIWVSKGFANRLAKFRGRAFGVVWEALHIALKRSAKDELNSST